MTKTCRGKRFKKPYDWIRIKQEFLSCLCPTLAEFSRRHQINLKTLKAHIKAKEKEQLIEDIEKGVPRPDLEIANSVQISEVEQRRQVYVKALQRATEASGEILEKTLIDFRRLTGARGKWRSAAEAGNLILRAGEVNRELASELQGIPREDDAEIWPVTRKFWPLPSQRDFLFDFPTELEQVGEKGFIFAYIGGVGAGKTHAGARKFGEAVRRNRGFPCAVYAPTYRMLEDSTKQKFVAQLSEMGLSFRYRATDKILTLFGDTPISFRSMDDPEHLRGPEYAVAWIDEGLQMADRSPFDIIMGRVGRAKAFPEPCLIFTGTPNGLTWGYDILVEEAETHDVRIYEARTDQNIHLDPAYYKRLLALYDERFAEQELHGKFIDVHKGRAYYAFTRALHVVKADTYTLDAPLDLCVDFNVAPMCWNVTQDFMARGDWVTYIQDEIHIDDTSTEKAAEEFARRYPDHKDREVRIFGDATGQHRIPRTTLSDYDVLRDTLEAKGFKNVEIRIGRSNPAVTDRVNSMNGRLLNAQGVTRLFVHEKCKETIIDFERVAFKPGTRELDKRKKKDGSFTHHTDAIGYKIDRLWPVRKVVVGGLQRGIQSVSAA